MSTDIRCRLAFYSLKKFLNKTFAIYFLEMKSLNLLKELEKMSIRLNLKNFKEMLCIRTCIQAFRIFCFCFNFNILCVDNKN